MIFRQVSLLPIWRYFDKFLCWLSDDILTCFSAAYLTIFQQVLLLPIHCCQVDNISPSSTADCCCQFSDILTSFSADYCCQSTAAKLTIFHQVQLLPTAADPLLPSWRYIDKFNCCLLKQNLLPTLAAALAAAEWAVVPVGSSLLWRIRMEHEGKNLNISIYPNLHLEWEWLGYIHQFVL